MQGPEAFEAGQLALVVGEEAGYAGDCQVGEGFALFLRKVVEEDPESGVGG